MQAGKKVDSCILVRSWLILHGFFVFYGFFVFDEEVWL